MKWTLGFALILLGMTGCAALQSAGDWLFGLDPQTGEDKPGPAPSETGGGLLGTIFPWAGFALTAAKDVYTEIRKRRYYAALKSTVRGVESLFDRDGDGNITKAEIEAALASQHQKDGVQPLVQSILGLIKK